MVGAVRSDLLTKRGALTGLESVATRPVVSAHSEMIFWVSFGSVRTDERVAASASFFFGRPPFAGASACVSKALSKTAARAFVFDCGA
ncbi:hypothetical protein D9M70_585800 [compost metagenome]